ncbi:endonuclease/exonuclease/phosphatase family protein [Croceibacterium sp. LX-88]|uniref:Endonuclease/exonuclease/phosphatase family protein n=1 Tax=Croceibacterium selenioxidans TaxID=2838833 RepID=A0ABS5W0N9_9SPHN|nr:endonuclease/exonuclease/phosphatase family protein [Croceibacterium selenioxidans]MBT2132808.1 endonuclease/exonuclease/phosphatase family protein [Croceibacterium selenioxidans]
MKRTRIGWRHVSVMMAVAIILTLPFGRLSGTIDAFTSFLPFAPLFALAAFIPGRGSMSRVVKGIAVCVFLVAAVAMVPEVVAPGRANATGASGQRLTLITQNVSVRNSDPIGTIDALLASGADIVLLQETDGAVGSFHPRLKQRFPYHSPCGESCSAVIYSRLPLIEAQYRARTSGGDEFGPPLLWAVAKLEDGTQIPIVTYHQPWPLPAARQARWRETLPDALASLGTQRLILGGDFNLTPWSSAMHQLDGDLAPLSRGTRAAFSFPAKIAGISWPVPFLPIDHVYTGPQWSVQNVEVLPAMGSDHHAIRADLVLTQPAVAG